MTTGGFPGEDLLVGVLGFGLALGAMDAVGRSIRRGPDEDDSIKSKEELLAARRKNDKLKMQLAKYKEKKSSTTARHRSMTPSAKAGTQAKGPKYKQRRGRGKQNGKR